MVLEAHTGYDVTATFEGEANKAWTPEPFEEEFTITETIIPLGPVPILVSVTPAHRSWDFY